MLRNIWIARGHNSIRSRNTVKTRKAIWIKTQISLNTRVCRIVFLIENK
jgi:hypothetical protein